LGSAGREQNGGVAVFLENLCSAHDFPDLPFPRWRSRNV